jgi:GTP cyclohydrolase FolE2
LVLKDRYSRGALEFIDAEADVQSESAHLPVAAGVANLRVLFNGGNLNMPVDLSIQTSTGLHRGVHMSRLVRAANARNATGMEEWLRWICREVNKSQPGTSVTSTFELPYNDQFARMKIRTTEKGALTYMFKVSGMTACPCSKKMIGVGHMQRAEISVVLRSRKAVDSLRVIDRIKECFSATPKEEMKRVEEAKKIMEAQGNPKFAEDLVRECVAKFPGAEYVNARTFESIHLHDAVATWSARPGWMPAM